MITADEGLRGGRIVPLKKNVDEAIELYADVTDVIVVKRTGAHVPMQPGRDVWYDEERAKVSADCPPEPMGAEDPLFILYTSGSTGKPKGVLHTTGGYLTWAAHTHELVFDYRPGEIFWCTADVGWVTGHSYIVYGPLANGATTLIFEGVPNYPTSSRFWEVIDKHKVEIFYTAPTALRALMREGDGPVQKTSRASLRLLGTRRRADQPGGLALVPPGGRRRPLPDRRHLVADRDRRLPDLAAAGRDAAQARLGHQAAAGREAADRRRRRPVPQDGAVSGNLCILDSWPGQMRTVYGDHERFIATYFTTYPGKYFTGDGCRRDEDGYYWITGRVDDVINVSGHRLGTAEVESALVAHHHVAEAAVVGYPHDIKGQGIYAYVTLTLEAEPSEALRKELVQWVRREIGPFASPDVIQFAPGLPKTRSGKIMRRILARWPRTTSATSATPRRSPTRAWSTTW